MLSKEQVKSIKEQIISQIDSWKATEEQKKAAKQEIQDMPAEKLEEFLVKNKLIREQPAQQTADLSTLTKSTGKTTEQCIFCLIVQEKISSYKIAEDKENLAVLEINPISKGHTIIIPKGHTKIEKLPSTSFTLAKKITRKLKSKLKPERVEISTSEFQGHSVINILPIYKKMPKERKKASEEELKQLQEKLKTKERKTTTKSKKKLKKKTEKLEKAPRRIP